ncbi:enoyl-CoA hydratase/isomerase family protein [Paenibacillus periandrae]|uniref:enoyl-CoA hydratase/isomerase family protein n=1 Tax=Paenibacillus periandrae TaxID=1761741 RepID=UPI001F09F93F|nr:enoyl-CoA hydratase/isomerase family protein [Paenibacillus periandrae]
MSYTFLQTQSVQHVLVVTISREEKLNAMNSKLMQELTDCFRFVHETPEVRAVVLTGKGKAFMAGADIGEYSGLDAGQFFAFQDKGREMYRSIESCAKPIVAAVNGFALGGGFELALACDLIFASAKAKFGLPEVNLGLVPGGGGLQKVARLMGPYAAKELALTGRFLTADEGLQAGLVSRVMEPEALLDAAIALAQDLARKAPLALQVIKKLINEGRDASLETAQAYDRAFLANLFRTEDAQEGIAAFIEKREARFIGK